ncbi:MAG: hypothetical protein HC826_02475 [Rhodospirillales bacterium]|nr:hypothetical protein [Rhodospirillales bacterium]
MASDRCRGHRSEEQRRGAGKNSDEAEPLRPTEADDRFSQHTPPGSNRLTARPRQLRRLYQQKPDAGPGSKAKHHAGDGKDQDRPMPRNSRYHLLCWSHTASSIVVRIIGDVSVNPACKRCACSFSVASAWLPR